ncbi:MAG: transporter, family, 4-hydroxybenzoate transporter [Sphingomonadales bacterium]|jgi:AAHS family 4-hydroxybenzoate transporter-like MFS transporter|nr:transporter, family, 4-hydroxybenzoate transporter [Sphingomonadales bacterium]
MRPAATIRMPAFLDERRIAPYQYLVVVLCGLVMFIDGFDTQSISYMAPFIARDWGLSKQLLGPILSASLVGLMVGYLFVSPLAGRFGDKAMIVASTLVFGIATIAGVWAGSVTSLIALRLITGIGLGACVPSAVALTAEYSPKRVRATFVLLIYCGFSLGFIVAGLVAGALLQSQGWRSLFWVGGTVPLLLVPLLVLFLPDSIGFMVRRGQDRRLAVTLRRIDPGLARRSQPVVELAGAGPQETRRAALPALFTGGRLAGTLLLWLVFAINLGEFYALQSWLPSIMLDLGHPMSVVVSATTLTTVGGIAVVGVIGPAMDRLGAFRSLAMLYALGFLFVGAAAFSFHAPVTLLLGAIFLAGCAVSGGQKSVIALAAVFYPVEMRSAGIGWALGIGRVGGILGPLLVGFALTRNASPASVFVVMAILMLLNSVIIRALGTRYETAANNTNEERQQK